MARGASRTPTDWVTRAADDAIRHARRGRPASPTASSPAPPAPARRGRCTWATCASSSPCTSWPRRSAAAASPVRHLHSWDDYDRFRKVPAGVDPSWSRAHRPPPVGRARPVAVPPVVGRALQGAAAALAARAGRGDGGGLADRGLPPRRLPRAGPAPPSRAATRSSACWRATAPRRAGAAAEPVERAGGRRAGRLRGQRRRDRADRAWAPPTTSPASPTSPTAATAAATPRSSPPTTTTRPTCPTPAPSCGYDGVDQPAPTRPRGQAGLEGRLADALVGRGRRLRAGRRRPRLPGLVVHRRQGAGEASTAAARRRSSATPSSAPAARSRCRPRAAGCRPRPTRCRSSRRRCCAGSTCAARPSRPSTSTSAPRSCGSTTSGTPWPARPPTPTKRDAQVLAFERASATAAAGTLPTPRGRGAVPAALLGGRRDRRQRRPDQPHRRRRRATSTPRSPTSSRGWARR